MSYDDLERALKTAPATWVPALLRALVNRAQEADVFVEGGLIKFVENSMKKKGE